MIIESLRAVDDVLHRHHPTVDEVAGHPRRTVCYHRGARGRPQAVRPDQRRALVLRAVLAEDDHAVAAVVEADDASGSFQRDLFARAASLEHGAVEVTAMDDEIAVLVAREERSAERNARQLAA